MVEGPAAKAYALRMSDEFKSETIREVSARSKRIFIPVKELVGKRFVGSDSIGIDPFLFELSSCVSWIYFAKLLDKQLSFLSRY